jgi:uncharacterized protein (TIGR02145 family)
MKIKWTVLISLCVLSMSVMVSSNTIDFQTFSTQTLPKSINIGTQEWMVKNLNVDKFRNGSPIFHAETKEEWERAGIKKIPAWCYYNNDPANGEKYGKLYNWYAINDARGLAPAGWRIPSDEDWTILTDHLGGLDVAGLKMKSQIGWLKNGGNGTNSSGFNGLPGGVRDQKGIFKFLGNGGCWWSCTEVNTFKAWSRGLSDKTNSVGRSYGNNKALGVSVRCIKVTQNNTSNDTHYNMVSIGKQTWMTKNLSVKKFRNGDNISYVRNAVEWEKAAREGIPAYCFYDNDPANAAKYGLMYNWFAVIDPRGLAPVGWHVPSDAEWAELIKLLGGDNAAGFKLKSKTGWRSNGPGTGNGSNQSGFNGLPGGSCDTKGIFKRIEYSCSWWSRTPTSQGTAWARGLSFLRSQVARSALSQGFGFYVRCVKD